MSIVLLHIEVMIMEWNVVIRENIRSIIEEKGFVQKAVANRAGFSPQSFNNMLTGRRYIRADEIPRIAYALGCDSKDLYAFPRRNAV